MEIIALRRYANVFQSDRSVSTRSLGLFGFFHACRLCCVNFLTKEKVYKYQAAISLTRGYNVSPSLMDL